MSGDGRHGRSFIYVIRRILENVRIFFNLYKIICELSLFIAE